MTIELVKVELRKVDVHTRMPFRYGIATLTQVPYLLVYADFVVNGRSMAGIAADVLPPKWFTKRADAHLNDEIQEMLTVIQSAAWNGVSIGRQPSVFDWWHALHLSQSKSSLTDEHGQRLPPLLTGFGVSLLERAAIDAFCRSETVRFVDALQQNRFGIQLHQIHEELEGVAPNDLLPRTVSQIQIRHTVGMADPLSDQEIPQAEQLDDGLPQSLESCLAAGRAALLKIKLPSEPVEAITRFRGIHQLVKHWRSAASKVDQPPFEFTVDANEAFTDASDFRRFWDEFVDHLDSREREFLDDGLIVVEQPLHRSVALADATQQVFSAWNERPAMIIDESDGELHSLRRALEVGYDGTSHKNCKGVFKGVANVCYLRWLAARDTGREKRRLVWTGEDLMNLGPVALQQDLAVCAALGLRHVERNGHHYVSGLAHLPITIQQSALAAHDDLYAEFRSRQFPRPIPALRIRNGKIQLQSVLDAPFGYACDMPRDELELVASVP